MNALTNLMSIDMNKQGCSQSCLPALNELLRRQRSHFHERCKDFRCEKEFLILKDAVSAIAALSERSKIDLSNCQGTTRNLVSEP